MSWKTKKMKAMVTYDLWYNVLKKKGKVPVSSVFRKVSARKYKNIPSISPKI
jgi:phenylalanine-4-hydroxylase